MKQKANDVKWVAAYVTSSEKKRMNEIARGAGLDLRSYAIKRIRETETYGTESARMFASLHDIRKKLVEDYGIIILYYKTQGNGRITEEQANKAADEYCELADSIVSIAGTFWEWYAPYVRQKGA